MRGDVHRLGALVGIPSYKSDISGLHAINQLVDWLVHSEKCKLIYMAAIMGAGKTDLSVTFLQLIDDHYRRIRRSVGDKIDIQQPEFAANFSIDPDPDDIEVKEIQSWPDLQNWAEEGESDEDGNATRWFIFDEASTELTAQSGANAQDVAETMAPFVKKMRKKSINMIVIGHDKGDVHPAIRSMADFVDKTGLRTASFYAGIKKREPTGHLMDVSGIPPTSWGFDTDDMAEWSWGTEEQKEELHEGYTEEDFIEWRNEHIARVYGLTEISQPKLAKAMGLSQSSISTIWGEYKEKIESDQAVTTNNSVSGDSGTEVIAD